MKKILFLTALALCACVRAPRELDGQQAFFAFDSAEISDDEFDDEFEIPEEELGSNSIFDASFFNNIKDYDNPGCSTPYQTKDEEPGDVKLDNYEFFDGDYLDEEEEVELGLDAMFNEFIDEQMKEINKETDFF